QNLNAATINTTYPPDTYRARLNKPLSYRLETNGIRTIMDTDYLVGFFATDSNFYSAKTVCYPGVNEGLPSFYTDSVLTTPQIFTGSSPSGHTSPMTVVSGNPKTYAQMFVDNECPYTTGNHVQVHPFAFDGHGADSLISMRGPYTS